MSTAQLAVHPTHCGMQCLVPQCAACSCCMQQLLCAAAPSLASLRRLPCGGRQLTRLLLCRRLMGTGFSDVMTTEGSGNTPKHSSGAASDRPYGYGHPKYDPHLAQRNPLTRGISNEHLLKGQSDELSDATVLGGASSGGLPGNALVPSRQASGAVDANKWAVSPRVSVCSWVLWSGLGSLVQLPHMLCCVDGDSVRPSSGCC